MRTVTLRPATADDRAFIDGLSPRLSSVPRPAWHDLAAMEGFQDRHMAASFAPISTRRLARRPLSLQPLLRHPLVLRQSAVTW